MSNEGTPQARAEAVEADRRADDVLEPDNRLVLIAIVLGIIVGALLL